MGDRKYKNKGSKSSLYFYTSLITISLAVRKVIVLLLPGRDEVLTIVISLLSPLVLIKPWR